MAYLWEASGRLDYNKLPLGRALNGTLLEELPDGFPNDGLTEAPCASHTLNQAAWVKMRLGSEHVTDVLLRPLDLGEQLVNHRRRHSQFSLRQRRAESIL